MRYSQPVTQGKMQPVAGKYDIYIAGSDQIWDYKLTNFDTTYFLDFVKEGKKKCSYAASIGENLPPEEYQQKYKELLSDFDEILVREDYGADIVENLTEKRPEVVCDPTLLLTAEEWDKLLVEPKYKEKYILVYQLGINKEIVDFARRLHNKTGYRIVYIPFPLVGLLKCDCKITVGPAEWMGLFKNAEYVAIDNVNVGANPDANSDIISSMEKGSRVKVSGREEDKEGNKWYKVSADDSGTIGYMSTKYVNIVHKKGDTAK